MTTPNNYSAVLAEALTDAAAKATHHQKPIIKAIREGRKPGAAEGIVEKKDTSLVSTGDTETQEAIIGVVRERLGRDVYIHAEEDGVVNYKTVDEATVRVVIDPIDGTGNYTRGLNSTLAEAAPEDREYPRTGWGSMIAIQEKNSQGEWETVASGIYTPTKGDTPSDLKGKMYIAEDGIEGVTVTDLGAKSETVVTQPPVRDNSHANYLLSGFKDKKQPERIELDRIAASRTDSPAKNPAAVAQSATALISGQGAIYVNEMPNLHDQVAAVFLLKKAGFAVEIPPPVTKIDPAGDTKTYHPFVATDSVELTKQLADAMQGKKRGFAEKAEMGNVAAAGRQ